MNERLSAERWREKGSGRSPDAELTLRLYPAECPEVGVPLCSRASPFSCLPLRGVGAQRAPGGKKLVYGTTSRCWSPRGRCIYFHQHSQQTQWGGGDQVGSRRWGPKPVEGSDCLGFKQRLSSLGNEQGHGGKEVTDS